jgi:uncharacterized protein (DUF302 family)
MPSMRLEPRGERQRVRFSDEQCPPLKEEHMTSFEVVLDVPLELAEVEVRNALYEQGFGVLTEIDVAATFKEKLGVDRAPLKILGACNPGFAHRAILIDHSASLALPCNVVLEDLDGSTRVAIADPRDLMPGVELSELTSEVAHRLQAVVETLRSGSPA